MTKLIRHFDKDELIFILADCFGVETKDINLIPFITTEGYGQGEHEVLSVRAEVDLTNSDI